MPLLFHHKINFHHITELLFKLFVATDRFANRDMEVMTGLRFAFAELMRSRFKEQSEF